MSSLMPPSGLQTIEYCDERTETLETSLVVTYCRNPTEPGPDTLIRPIWLTSKSPALLRTV